MSAFGLTSTLHAILNLVPRVWLPGHSEEVSYIQGQDITRTAPVIIDNQSESLTTRCYGIYGCFTVDQPFLSLARPINVFPLPPSNIMPSICLFTRINPKLCQPVRVDDVRTMRLTSFRPGSKVKILTHGYLEHGRKNWLKNMVSEYLRYGDYNVMVVDWLAGSGPPYTQAVANIRLVGVILAHFIMALVAVFGIDLSDVHIVGHSLGAQLAGYTGEHLKKQGLKLGRITGLDPAEPHFEGTEPIVRLDSSDAALVDIIHTDAGPIITGGLGILEPAGHLDFYPNGGVTMPGCGAHLVESVAKEHGNIPYGIRRFIGCNHIRSYEYFTESINSQCPFLGIQCGSWHAYWKGACWQCGGRACARMGAHADVPYIAENSPDYSEYYDDVDYYSEDYANSIDYYGEYFDYKTDIYNLNDYSANHNKRDHSSDSGDNFSDSKYRKYFKNSNNHFKENVTENNNIYSANLNDSSKDYNVRVSGFNNRIYLNNNDDNNKNPLIKNSQINNAHINNKYKKNIYPRNNRYNQLHSRSTNIPNRRGSIKTPNQHSITSIPNHRSSNIPNQFSSTSNSIQKITKTPNHRNFNHLQDNEYSGDSRRSSSNSNSNHRSSTNSPNHRSSISNPNQRSSGSNHNHHGSTSTYNHRSSTVNPKQRGNSINTLNHNGVNRQLPSLISLTDIPIGDGTSKKLFLITGSDPPFCLYHHRVSVVMSYTNEAKSHGGDIGLFYITLTGTKATSPRIQLNPEEMFFEPGNVYQYMVGTEDLGHLQHASLEWRYVTAYYNPLTWRVLSNPSVFVNRVHIQSVEMQESYEFCGLDQAFQSGWVRRLIWREVCPDQAPPPGESILGTLINFDVTDTINNNIDAVNSGLNSLGNGQLISTLASTANLAAMEIMEDAKRRMGRAWPNRRGVWRKNVGNRGNYVWWLWNRFNKWDGERD